MSATASDDIWGHLVPARDGRDGDGGASPPAVPPLELPGSFGRVDLLGPLLGLPCPDCDSGGGGGEGGGRCGPCRALGCLARYTPKVGLLRFAPPDDGGGGGLRCTVAARSDRLVRVTSRAGGTMAAGGSARSSFDLSDGDSVALWGYRSGLETRRVPDLVPLVRLTLRALGDREREERAAMREARKQALERLGEEERRQRAIDERDERRRRREEEVQEMFREDDKDGGKDGGDRKGGSDERGLPVLHVGVPAERGVSAELRRTRPREGERRRKRTDWNGSPARRRRVAVRAADRAAGRQPSAPVAARDDGDGTGGAGDGDGPARKRPRAERSDPAGGRTDEKTNEKVNERPRKAKTPPWHLLNPDWGKGQDSDGRAGDDAAPPPPSGDAGSAGKTTRPNGTAPPAEETRTVRIPRREYDVLAIESVEEVRSNEIVIGVGGLTGRTQRQTQAGGTPPRGEGQDGGRTQTQSCTPAAGGGGGRTQTRTGRGDGGQNDSPQVGGGRRAPGSDGRDPPGGKGGSGGPPSGVGSPHRAAEGKTTRNAPSSGAESREASRSSRSGGSAEGAEASGTRGSRDGRTQATERSSAPLGSSGQGSAETCVAGGKARSSRRGGCTQGTERSSEPLTCPGLRPHGRSTASSPRRTEPRDASRTQSSRRGEHTQGTEQSSAPLTCPGLIRPVGAFGTGEERSGTRDAGRTRGSRKGHTQETEHSSAPLTCPGLRPAGSFEASAKRRGGDAGNDASRRTHCPGGGGLTQGTEQSSAPLTCPGLRAAGTFDSGEGSPRPPDPPPRPGGPPGDAVPAPAPAGREDGHPGTVDASSLSVARMARLLRDDEPAAASLRRAALSLAVAAGRAGRPGGGRGEDGGGTEAGADEWPPRLLRGTEVSVPGALLGEAGGDLD